MLAMYAVETNRKLNPAKLSKIVIKYFNLRVMKM